MEKNNLPVVLDTTKHQAVLVKFTMLDQALIPPSIARRGILSEQEMDVRHAKKAMEAKRADLAVEGRVRGERVDTGVHSVDNYGPVQLATIRRALRANGYQLKDVYAFQKVRKVYPNSPKLRSDLVYVVVLDFVYGSPTTPLFKEVLEGIRDLARRTWQYCHIWDNSQINPTVTVNLGGRLSESDPKYAVVIRDHTLRCLPVERQVEEHEE